MTNLQRAVDVFGFDPFRLRYTNNPVDYIGVTGTMQYGPIWMVEVKGQWYSHSEWLRSQEGCVPKHSYYYDQPSNWWRMQENPSI